MLGAIQTKFQIAFAIGFFGLIVILLTPYRRTLCLVIWVLVFPLSIEKILFTAGSVWGSFRGQEIVITMADVVLLMLAAIVVVEAIATGKKIVIWNKNAQLFTYLLLWGVISYCIHLVFFDANYTSQSPFGLLHLARNLFFVLVISAAIQTRSDLIWILLAIALSLLAQSALVGFSYATGEVYNFSRLLGLNTGATQTYSGAGGQIVRATGTLGVANQQALYHAMFSFLLIGLLVVKNKWIQTLALGILLASFVAVLFTFSRTSWMSMGLAAILLVILFMKRRAITPQAWVIGGFLAICFIGALGYLAQPIIDRLTSGDDGATASRVRMMSLATDLFLTHPIIGVGPNEYVEAGLELYPPSYKDTEWVALGERPIVPPVGRIEIAQALVEGKILTIPLQVHNKYMLTLSELGLIGLILWLLILYQFWRDAKVGAKSTDKLYQFTAIAGYGVVLVAALYMMLDLFVDEKTLQITLFPLLVISAVGRLSNIQVNRN